MRKMTLSVWLMVVIYLLVLRGYSFAQSTQKGPAGAPKALTQKQLRALFSKGESLGEGLHRSLSIWFNHDQIPEAAGPTTLHLLVYAGEVIPPILVRLVETRNLYYYGVSEWTLAVKSGDTESISLPITIPEDDTSGIALEAFSGERHVTCALYWTPEEDGITYWDFDPRFSLTAQDKRPTSNQAYLNQVIKTSPVTFQVLAPLQVQLVGPSTPQMPGICDLRLKVIATVDCPEVTVTITDARNLGYAGKTEWVLALKAGDTAIYNLRVTIPAADTSGMSVIAKGCEAQWDRQCYFVPENGALKTWWIDPRNSMEAGLRKSYSKRIGISDSEFWERMKPSNGRTLIGYPDEHGNIISEDSAHKMGLDQPQPIYPGPGDTGTVTITNPPARLPMTASETLTEQRRQKEELERTPLTTADVQTIPVGDSSYTRYRGESKFHPSIITTDPSGYAKRRGDSIMALHVNDPISLVLDLRDPKDLENARLIVDSMKAVNDSGAYRVWMRLDKARQMREMKLKEIRERKTSGAH